MSWTKDHLEPVETLLFRSELVKVGTFFCDVNDPSFRASRPLDNDVFVLPQRPLWIRRNDDDYRFVEPGAIIMHRAGSTLERRQVSSCGDRAYWFGVHPTIFVEALTRNGLSTENMGGAILADLNIHYRLAVMLKQLRQDSSDRLAIEEEVLTLFYALCERRAQHLRTARSPRRSTANRQRILVDRARAYLDEHLTEAVGLDKVADEAGTSLYHLCRVFREQMGLTMHAYRTRQRLGQIVDRLVDGSDNSLTELALDFGFSSHSHLSRVFQKQLGVPPSTIRP